MTLWQKFLAWLKSGVKNQVRNQPVAGTSAGREATDSLV